MKFEIGFDRTKCINEDCNNTYVVDCQEGDNWQLYCDNCLCSIEMPTRDQAISAWNARAGGWRPIEEAPKDGTKVLVWGGTFQADNSQMHGMRSEDVEVVCYIEKVNSVDSPWTMDNDMLIRNPTHFQPLPAPPTEASK